MAIGAKDERAGVRRVTREAAGLRAGDVLAGITVALVLVPQSLAYAQLAGMPSYRGLYAAVLPPIVAALFASSPYLQTGPVAVTSLLTLGALSSLAPLGSDEYVALGLLLALIVGASRLVIGFARGGVIAYLMSQPVLLGFTSGAAILIVCSQVPAAVGVEAPGEGILERAAYALAHVRSWNITSLVLAAATLALMLAGPRAHPLFPAALVAAALAILYSRWAGYEGEKVGAIPVDPPPFSIDLAWGSFSSLVVPGIVIAVVGFAEPAAIARTFAAAERRVWDPNRELVSQGAANVAAAFSGGFPVGGSFSRSALNRTAGAKTRLSGAVTGFAVLAFLPFASSVSPLPRAVLAAIVVSAVVGLIRIPSLVRFARYSQAQFVVGVLTLALTLALSPHVERALVVGVMLSVALHLRRELRLEVLSWTEDETLHLRPRGVLWFGAARRLEDAVLELVAGHPDATRLAVHLDGLGRIDITGALALRALLADAREAGLAVDVVDVRPRWRALVARVIERVDDPLA
ncbi:MAG: SulP family inorganic anion transporter [Actinomycetota bacterium]|nr:SulP family inorganic anion transporter [Actinomycetota bacterium]